MKRTIALLLMLSLLLTGCIISDGTSYEKSENLQLLLTRCDGEYLGTENWNTIYEFMPETELMDGEFAIITADVTFLTGGEAGYQQNVQIDKLKSCEIVSAERAAMFYEIPDVTETDFSEGRRLLMWQYGETLRHILFNREKYTVYQGCELIGTYDTCETIGGVRVLRRNDTTTEQITTGCGQGITACPEYCVLPMIGEEQDSGSQTGGTSGGYTGGGADITTGDRTAITVRDRDGRTVSPDDISCMILPALDGPLPYDPYNVPDGAWLLQENVAWLFNPTSRYPRRYFPEDELHGLKITCASTYYQVYDGESKFNGCYAEFEGSLSLKGVIRVEQTDGTFSKKGDIIFTYAEGSKIPEMNFDDNPPDKINLGNIDSYPLAVTEGIPRDGSSDFAEVTISGLKLQYIIDYRLRGGRTIDATLEKYAHRTFLLLDRDGSEIPAEEVTACYDNGEAVTYDPETVGVNTVIEVDGRAWIGKESVVRDNAVVRYKTGDEVCGLTLTKAKSLYGFNKGECVFLGGEAEYDGTLSVVGDIFVEAKHEALGYVTNVYLDVSERSQFPEMCYDKSDSNRRIKLGRLSAIPEALKAVIPQNGSSIKVNALVTGLRTSYYNSTSHGENEVSATLAGLTSLDPITPEEGSGAWQLSEKLCLDLIPLYESVGTDIPIDVTKHPDYETVKEWIEDYTSIDYMLYLRSQNYLERYISVIYLGTERADFICTADYYFAENYYMDYVSLYRKMFYVKDNKIVGYLDEDMVQGLTFCKGPQDGKLTAYKDDGLYLLDTATDTLTRLFEAQGISVKFSGAKHVIYTADGSDDLHIYYRDTGKRYQTPISAWRGYGIWYTDKYITYHEYNDSGNVTETHVYDLDTHEDVMRPSDYQSTTTRVTNDEYYAERYVDGENKNTYIRIVRLSDRKEKVFDLSKMAIRLREEYLKNNNIPALAGIVDGLLILDGAKMFTLDYDSETIEPISAPSDEYPSCYAMDDLLITNSYDYNGEAREISVFTLERLS